MVITGVAAKHRRHAFLLLGEVRHSFAHYYRANRKILNLVDLSKVN